jgi:hypothetical protein
MKKKMNRRMYMPVMDVCVFVAVMGAFIMKNAANYMVLNR